MAKVFINQEGDFEKDPNQDIPAEDKALIESLKAYILSIYKPTASPLDADKRMSTEEIFSAFTRIYHNELFFSRNDLAKWLQQQGFTIWDAGDMRFEWLLKTIS
jgi:hypothetical protein